MTATVGAFARVEVEAAEAVRRRLAGIPGVEPFALDEPGKLGLVLEADDLDGAHDRLVNEVRRTAGVLGVWPIYVHAGDAGDGGDEGTALDSVEPAPEGADHAFDPT